MKTTNDILTEARRAKLELSKASSDKINTALEAMASALIKNADKILAANASDIERAESDGKISPVMIDRLRLNDARIEGMANGIREVASLPSPLGEVLYEVKRPNGLDIKRISVPFGVVAIIYESRPNVTSDAAALAIKSGNICVLRSGKTNGKSF